MIATCIVYFTLSSGNVNYNLQGKLIEQRGDNWLVDFSYGMKKYKELKTETQVILVNGNRCLIKEIK